MTETEICVACNGEGKYWTRRRDAEKEWHDCADCQGTGRMTLDPTAVDELLPVTTTKVGDLAALIEDAPTDA
jgi:hypothetical protein